MKSPTGWTDPVEPEYWSQMRAWQDFLRARAAQREAEAASKTADDGGSSLAPIRRQSPASRGGMAPE